MKTTFKTNWKRLSVLFLGMAVLLLAGSFAAASELGVSYWRADGTITGRGEELGNGAENFYSLKLSPFGIGPVALVSNLTLSDSTLKSLANAQQILDGSYTGETANLNFDAMAGLRLRLPSILGVSATGVIGYGGTAFAKVTPNSTETYRYAYFYGPRFRGELRYDIIGGMLYATAGYEFATDLQGKTGKGGGDSSSDAETGPTTLCIYDLGLRAHVPFLTVGAGYRDTKLKEKDIADPFDYGFKGYYAEAVVGF